MSHAPHPSVVISGCFGLLGPFFAALLAGAHVGAHVPAQLSPLAYAVDVHAFEAARVADPCRPDAVGAHVVGDRHRRRAPSTLRCLRHERNHDVVARGRVEECERVRVLHAEAELDQHIRAKEYGVSGRALGYHELGAAQELLASRLGEWDVRYAGVDDVGSPLSVGQLDP